jgi:hypothetical protein
MKYYGHRNIQIFNNKASISIFLNESIPPNSTNLFLGLLSILYNIKVKHYVIYNKYTQLRFMMIIENPLIPNEGIVMEITNYTQNMFTSQWFILGKYKSFLPNQITIYISEDSHSYFSFNENSFNIVDMETFINNMIESNIYPPYIDHYIHLLGQSQLYECLIIIPPDVSQKVYRVNIFGTDDLFSSTNMILLELSFAGWRIQPCEQYTNGSFTCTFFGSTRLKTPDTLINKIPLSINECIWSFPNYTELFRLERYPKLIWRPPITIQNYHRENNIDYATEENIPKDYIVLPNNKRFKI